MKIVVASKNPVKIKAVLKGFSRSFPEENLEILPVEIDSGVSFQPLSDKETLQGALNRAKKVRDLIPDADYWVGIEGGVDKLDIEYISTEWVVITNKDTVGKSRACTFPIPKEISNRLEKGEGLGGIIDSITNRKDTKKEEGAVGFLSNNLISREHLYEEAVILALTVFNHPQI